MVRWLRMFERNMGGFLSFADTSPLKPSHAYRQRLPNSAPTKGAMRQVPDCQAELPPQMQDAINQFRIQLGAAIDSVYLVKRALNQDVHGSEYRLD